MEAFNTDLTQVLKWMHNKAPNIQALINSKNEWYEKYNDQFWSNWERDVFNLDTVNEFGVYVWCEILNLPKELFVFDAMRNNWAYGKERQNYKYSGLNTNIPVANRNTVGGNFFGAGNFVIRGLAEARIILKLRYMTLVSDGRISSINEMIKHIVNEGRDWDFASKKMFYVIDDGTASSVNASFASPTITVQDWRGEWTASKSPRKVVGNSNLNYTFTYWAPQTGAVSSTSTIKAPDGVSNATVWLANGVSNYVPITPSPVRPNPVYIYPSGPKMGYLLSVYLKRPTTASEVLSYTILGAQPTTGANSDPISFWFVNQELEINFPDYLGSDPILTVKPSSNGQTSGTTTPVKYNTSRDYAGWEPAADGWIRVWFMCVTSSSVAQSQISKNIIYQTIRANNATSKNLTFWGPQFEVISDVNSPSKPSPLIYKSSTIGNEYSQTDVVMGGDANTTTATFAANDTGSPTTSLLSVGAKAFASGRWKGWPIEVPFQFATGDGSTRQYTLTPPPDYQPPFNASTKMQYVVGSGLGFSAQFINLISSREYGILPANAGIPYSVYVSP